ncbi:ABC transporter permease [Rhizobium puerariae]|uniref:ABC transporter permease n=1 Tax=Rhizobium puerariae TaxID=1585791 RepID=UPI00366AD2C0
MTTFASIVAQTWWAALNISVYYSLYMFQTGTDFTFGSQSAISYVWLQQATLALLPFYCDPDIAGSIRSGSILYDRTKPVDTYSWWYTRNLTRVASRLFPRFTVIIVFAAICLPTFSYNGYALEKPSEATRLFAFFVSIFLGLLVSAAIAVIMDAIAVRTLSVNGVNAVAMPLVLFFAGGVIPLPFLPEWAQFLTFLLPFSSLVDIPIRIYLGVAIDGYTYTLSLIQITWLILLISAGRYIINRTILHLEVHGG